MLVLDTLTHVKKLGKPANSAENGYELNPDYMSVLGTALFWKKIEMKNNLYENDIFIEIYFKYMT